MNINETLPEILAKMMAIGQERSELETTINRLKRSLEYKQLNHYISIKCGLFQNSKDKKNQKYLERQYNILDDDIARSMVELAEIKRDLDETWSEYGELFNRFGS